MSEPRDLPGAIAVAGVVRPANLSGEVPPDAVAPASDEQLALARRAPAFVAAMAAKTERLPLDRALGSLALALMVAVGFWVSIARLPGVTPLISIPVGVLFVGILVAISTRWRKRLFAPLERKLGSVVLRHHYQLGHDDDGTPLREQRLLLALEDGSRRHLAGTDTVMASIAEGDIGVAVIQFDRLVAFHRIVA